MFQGEFYSVQSHTDPPFKAEPFNLPEDKGHMLSLGLSEFTVNSASYAYFSAGLLQAQINDSMVCVRVCVGNRSPYKDSKTRKIAILGLEVRFRVTIRVRFRIMAKVRVNLMVRG